MIATSLLAKEELQKVHARAVELLAELHADASHPHRSLRRSQIRARAHAIAESLRFCAVAASALRDPSLADVVLDAIERLRQLDDRQVGPYHRSLQAVSALLRAGAPADKQVRELAKSTSERVRLAVASGLVPRGPAELELLHAMAADSSAEVRSAARKSLEAAGGAPWWTGKWNSDPGARLLPEEVATSGAALRRVNELLDLPLSQLVYHDKETLLPELLQHLGAIPDALAVEPIEKLCAGADHHLSEASTPLLLHMLGREGGADAFLRVLEAWSRSDKAILHELSLGRWLRDVPDGRRAELCRKLFDFVKATPIGEQWEARRTAGKMAAGALRKAWRAEEDVTPLFEEVLRLAEDQNEEHRSEFFSAVSDVLRADDLDPTPLLDRLCEARVAGYPGPMRRIATQLNDLIQRAPAELLRRTAERALQSDDPGTIRWGAERLLGDQLDPERDGDPFERARALFADPRLRAAMIGRAGLVSCGVAALRIDLRRGALSYPEAAATIEAIGHLYGGLTTMQLMRKRLGEEPDEEQARREHREEVASFLGPDELRGPPTEAEWEALRQARAAWKPTTLEAAAQYFANTLREGPWTADERAELDVFFEAFRGGEQDLDYPLAQAIARKPEVELMDKLDEIIARCTSGARGLLKHMRTELRATLGLSPVPQGKAAGATGEEGLADEEWEDGDE